MNNEQNNFFSQEVQNLLQIDGFRNFADLWQVDCNWSEINFPQTAGQCTAAEYELHRENGERVTIFIRRQEHPAGRIWERKPPLRNEWRNLVKLTRCRIAVPQPLYFGEQRQDGYVRTILVTYKLHGYRPLNEFLGKANINSGKEVRTTAVSVIAGAIRCFHDCRFRHNRLYPENIMLKVRRDGSLAASEIRLVGLEEVRRVFSPLRARISDLETLLGHCPDWSVHEKNLFLNYYLNLQLNRLPPKQLAAELWKIPLVKWIKRRMAARLKNSEA